MLMDNIENLDEESFGKGYQEFKDDVLEMLENSSFEEYYPPAIFMVDREGNGSVFYIEDYMEEHQEAERDTLVNEEIPSVIQKYAAKIFALILPGYSEKEPNEHFIFVAFADANQVELFTADVFEDEDGDLYLDDWDEKEPEEYANILAPFKRAVSFQG